MKPRLESAELTDEDCVALVFMGEKRGHCGMLEAHGRYLEADSRDAALMLQCQETWRAGHRRSRPDHPYAGPLEVAWCGYLVDCGGDITRLA